MRTILYEHEPQILLKLENKLRTNRSRKFWLNTGISRNKLNTEKKMTKEVDWRHTDLSDGQASQNLQHLPQLIAKTGFKSFMKVKAM